MDRGVPFHRPGASFEKRRKVCQSPLIGRLPPYYSESNDIRGRVLLPEVEKARTSSLCPDTGLMTSLQLGQKPKAASGV